MRQVLLSSSLYSVNKGLLLSRSCVLLPVLDDVECFPKCSQGGICLPGNRCQCQRGTSGPRCEKRLLTRFNIVIFYPVFHLLACLCCRVCPLVTYRVSVYTTRRYSRAQYYNALCRRQGTPIPLPCKKSRYVAYETTLLPMPEW